MSHVSSDQKRKRAKKTQELGSLTVYGKQNPCNCARYLGSGFGGLMVKIINFIWEFLKWGEYVGSMCYIEKYPYFPGSA